MSKIKTSKVVTLRTAQSGPKPIQVDAGVWADVMAAVRPTVELVGDTLSAHGCRVMARHLESEPHRRPLCRFLKTAADHGGATVNTHTELDTATLPRRIGAADVLVTPPSEGFLKATRPRGF